MAINLRRSYIPTVHPFPGNRFGCSSRTFIHLLSQSALACISDTNDVQYYTDSNLIILQLRLEEKIDRYNIHTYIYIYIQIGVGRMVFWEGYISDESMGTFAPLVVYWLYAGFYQLLPPLDNYRLHTRAEENDKNLVPLRSVIKGVLLQQFVQAIVAQLLFLVTSNSTLLSPTVQPSLPVQALQFIIGMFVMDTWQYFVHRYMHQNKFLYKHIHSQHHRLVVPYAVGALYNHPLEGLLLDTFGGALSFLVSGMTARTSVYFFCFAVVKTIDDHCGLWLPGNIFHLIFQNNTAYHDVHHQLQGTKFNYSQPFFPIWDKILGTYVPYTLVKRPEGGFEARLKKD
ncbi:very-long-chain aldehyde decarbonylase GL1-9-like [Andrographis paniculata]|uniref:very-long-chain aldehyde decarbonylase GL1-9-like n=1 Tax=Andrographis paniculata TaxID=175694 RepID=UPI0021E81D9B|nr:very-long-chain aldehyde decarbonylase GL1-9-like [Andrographis paniculata]XP_051126362.1 very-long-chain aldehyde decarbonylase GL1-9-like [Andrographis paniculata]